MTDIETVAPRVARVSAFATLGTLGTTQEIVRLVLPSLKGGDPELVAEETLTLLSVTTARAAEVGLKDDASLARATTSALYDIPFLYRDYLIGGNVILEKDESLLDEAEVIYQSLQRKREFYSAHFPAGKFPGEHALRDKLDLWMGRVSPPGQADLPSERVQGLDIVPIVLTHLKLVLAFARRSADD